MDAGVYRAALKGSWEDLINHLHGLKCCLHDQVTPTGNSVLHVHLGRPLVEGKTNGKYIRKVLEHEAQSGERSMISWRENENGEIPLHVAAKFGHVEAVEDILWWAKKVNMEEVRKMLRKKNKRKDTALHEAARAGYYKIVERLVNEDSSCPHEANEDKETPLYLAAERGCAHCVTIILKSCDPSALAFDHKGPCGRTVLHVLFQWRRPTDMARKLLNKHESLIRLQDDEGLTPLHRAAAENKFEYLRVLLSYDKSNTESAAYIKDNEGRTPLLVATIHHNWDSMKLLIEHRPDCIEIVDNRGQNVLHYAANWACIKKLERFLRIRRDFSKLMSHKDSEGNTPLHLVAVNAPHMTCICFHGVEKFMKRYHQCMRLFNKKNLTPLDLLATHYHSSRVSPQRDGQIATKTEPEARGTTKDKWKRSDYDEAQNRLVVAALVATVSFTAGFTVPGGFDQSSGPDIGTAVMYKKTAFKAFMVSDTIALTFSSLAVLLYLLFEGHGAGQSPMVRLICQFTNILNKYSVGMMMLAFVTGVYTVLPHSHSLQTAVFMLSALSFSFYVLHAFGIVFGIARYFHII